MLRLLINKYHGRSWPRAKAVAIAYSLAGWRDRNDQGISTPETRRRSSLPRRVCCQNSRPRGDNHQIVATQWQKRKKLDRKAHHGMIRAIRCKHRIPGPSLPVGTLNVNQVRERHGVSLWSSITGSNAVQSQRCSASRTRHMHSLSMMRWIGVFENGSQTQGVFVHHSQRRLHEGHYARCVGGLEADVGSVLRIGSMVEAAVIKMRLRS
jgi:hypothetical protein